MAFVILTPRRRSFGEAACPVKPGLMVGLLLAVCFRTPCNRALEVPLSLLYALSGDERCSSAQWGIRKGGGAN